MSKKKKAAAVGILALIGIGLWASTAKADDKNGGLKVKPSKRKPGDPKGPGDLGDDDPDCPPGTRWDVAAGECVPAFVPSPAEPGEDPTVVVNRYLSPRPPTRTGTLFAIQFGDNPTDLAKQVIRAEFGDVNANGIYTPRYVGLMATHSWNFALYSAIWEPDDPESPDYPSQRGRSKRTKMSYRRYTAEQYDPNGVLRSWTIKDAFLRHHAKNLTLLRGGHVPERATDEWGEQLAPAQKYGLIWLPKILEFGGNGHVEVEADVPADLAALAPNIYG